jgi:iron complex outermembrane receptor protein
MTVEVRAIVRLAMVLSLLSSAVGVWALPVRAQEEGESSVNDLPFEESQPLIAHDQGQQTHDQPATTVEEWVAQIEASLVQITAVRVEATETGMQVILETETGSLNVPETRSLGNALIADIPNAAIAEEFSQADPIEGIALVSVTSLPGDRVRIAITGSDAPPTAEVTSEAQGLAFAVTLGEAGTAADEDAIQVVVTGEQDEGYNPSSSSTATRTDTPLRDVPASIQVIPQEVIEDQGVTRLQDVVRNNAPGVTTEAAYTFDGNFIIRGFAQNFTFVNSYRSADNYSVVDLANVERIEVLRGPASVLFGQLQPGGIVNIVTEQPLREPTYTVGFTGGQFSFYRPEIDFSGPLTEDGNLRYRLNAAYQNSGSFRDFVNEERFFVAPVLQWDISEDTSLTVDFAYQFSHVPLDSGIRALSDDSLVLPINRFLNYPSLIDYDTEQFRASYRLEHEFNDDWRIRNAFSFFSRSSTGPSNNVFSSIDDRFVPPFYYEDEDLRETYLLQTDLIGNFSTGSIQHELLVGFDLTRLTQIYNGGSVELPPIDIFNPDYEVDRPDTPPRDFPFVNLTSSLGIYLQDQIIITDNLRLLLGGRVDFAEQENTSGGSDTTQSDSAFSPRVGIVYQPIEPISLYASYSQSFFPVVGQSRDDSAFEPERGTQYEIGIKADITNNLSATLAAFDITKSNVLTTDPRDSNFSIQVGEQRSQGIELVVSGEILPGWNIIAGYAYTDAQVTEDNSIPEGDNLRNVPRHAANLWTTYEIQSGDFQGLGFGLGLVYVDERESAVPNISFRLPSYVRADAALFFRRDNWRVAINVNNLFDTEYYENAYGRDNINPGAPINVTASLSYTF